jgi:hypothetical protein
MVVLRGAEDGQQSTSKQMCNSSIERGDEGRGQAETAAPFIEATTWWLRCFDYRSVTGCSSNHGCIFVSWCFERHARKIRWREQGGMWREKK